MSETNTTAVVRARSVINRDTVCGRVIHIRALVVHRTGETDGSDAKTLEISPLDLSELEASDFVPPVLDDEVPLGYAHFILFRIDLATNGNELKEAMTMSDTAFNDHGDRSRRTSTFLTSEISSEDLEDAMDAADDRWIDQVATLDLFVAHPDFVAADIFSACIKELLSFTNPTSGLVVAAEYPCGRESAEKSPAMVEEALDFFGGQDTELRTIVNAYPNPNKDDTIWIVSGLALATRTVETSTHVRLN